VSVLNSKVSVNNWKAGEDESLNELRPAQCPDCGVAAYDGGRVVIHGHGKVLRGVEGPITVDGAAQSTQIVVRRFRCTACCAVMRVLPLELQVRMQFLWTTVAVVLAFWGIERVSLRELRVRWSPQRVYGPADSGGWRMVLRWAARAYARFDAGRLSYRAMAASVGQHVQSFTPSEFMNAELAARVWEGARRCVV
jgi:hypothetical protein